MGTWESHECYLCPPRSTIALKEEKNTIVCFSHILIGMGHEIEYDTNVILYV